MQTDLNVLSVVQHHCQDKGDDLADDGGHRSAGDLHAGQAEIAEDQDRVQDDVDDCAGALGDQGIAGAAGGLEQTLQEDLAENAEGHDADDADIGHTVGDGLSVRREGAHIDIGTENAEEDKEQGADSRQKDAVEGAAVDLVHIFFAQSTGEEGVDTDGDARGHADHDILHREGQGDGGEGVVVHGGNAGDEDAVHHVIQGLHQHGQGHGQGHGKEQPTHGTHAHFVFLQGFHYISRFPSIITHTHTL